MTELARLFRTGNARKAKWKKRSIYSVYELTVKPGSTLVIERVSASADRAQALHLGLDKGNLRANGVLMRTAAVWSHTAPTIAELEVVGRKAKSVDIWNGWSFEGVESAWLGNSAMMVSNDDDTLTLRCSDGLGDPNFDDLVVKVSVRP